MTEKTVPGIRSRGVRYWAERRGFRVVPPSTDVQDRLAGELPIDKPAGDRADLAPWSFDRDLRPQLFCGDQISEQREAGGHARSFVPAVLDQPGLVGTAQ